MGTLLDAFSKEDRVEVTFSDFYRLIRESTSAELMKKCRGLQRAAPLHKGDGNGSAGGDRHGTGW